MLSIPKRRNPWGSSLESFDHGKTDSNSFQLEVYVDASFGNLPDGGSQGAYVVYLSDGVSRSLVSWQSRKLRRIVKSTLAAETLSPIDGAECGILIQKILCDSFGISSNIQCFSDNASLVESVDSTNLILDKRRRIDMGVVRQMAQNCEIRVMWVDTSSQLANCLTKKGPHFSNLLENMHAFNNAYE